MNIQSILTTKGTTVITIAAQQPVREAIDALVRHDIGALVVVNPAGQPVGILSEREIVRAAVTDETLFSLPVSTLMSREIVTGLPQDELESVAHTMAKKRTRHIPIMEQGKLIGIISIGDIVKAQRDRYQGELYTLQTLLLGSDA